MDFNPAQLSLARIESLRSLLPQVVAAARTATAHARACNSKAQRFGRALRELLAGCAQSAAAQPWLALGLSAGYLLFAGSLVGLASAQAELGLVPLVRDGLLLTTVFGGAVLWAFGRKHLVGAYSRHYAVDAPGSLARATPEVFIAQAWDHDKLVGCVVTASGAEPLWLDPLPDEAAPELPCAYLLLRQRGGRALLHQLNVRTGQAYAWYAGAPVLRLHRDRWAQGYYEACQRLGVFEGLQVRAAAAEGPESSAADPKQARAREQERADRTEQGAEQEQEADPALLPDMPLEEACDVLGVDAAVDEDTLKKAWRLAAQHCHPDRYQQLPARMQRLAAREAQRVNDAYQVLLAAVRAREARQR